MRCRSEMVSRNVFSQVCAFVLREDEQEEADSTPDLACWSDAPNAEVRQGRAALTDGPKKYNQVGCDLLARFVRATGADLKPATGFSDRTGDYSLLVLARKP